MATAVLIDITNYSTNLVESTQGRAGTPDGNIFFDVANDRVELITAEELTNVDLGGGSEANPLTNALGITNQAIYAFERLRRRLNTVLRNYRPGVDGAFKFAGAFVWISGVKLADDATSTTGSDDRNKVRSSGWIERAANGSTDRIYFGVRSLNNIEATSQPFFQLSADTTEASLQSAAPVNFFRQGPVDEAVQVFGSTANGDTGAGSFDSTGQILVCKVREFGRTQGETTSTASGVAELNGFSAGFGFGEGVSPTADFTLADVFGGSQIAPFTGMGYEHFAASQSRSGFTDGSANFSDIVTNTGSGTLAEIRAWLDAIMLQDTDEDDGTGSFLPKRADPLYAIDSQGRLVTRQGLHIDGVATSDQQSIVQTDNTGATHIYPFQVEVRVGVSDAWQADAKGWYQCSYTDGAAAADFDTSGNTLVRDALLANVVGTSADAVGTAGSWEIVFSYAYTTDSDAGLTADTDKPVTFLSEGDGGAQAAITQFTIVKQATVTASAQAEAEENL